MSQTLLPLTSVAPFSKGLTEIFKESKNWNPSIIFKGADFFKYFYFQSVTTSLWMHNCINVFYHTIGTSEVVIYIYLLMRMQPRFIKRVVYFLDLKLVCVRYFVVMMSWIGLQNLAALISGITQKLLYLTSSNLVRKYITNKNNPLHAVSFENWRQNTISIKNIIG